jgi:DNA invertase Pin-like site-specific DNA recombinase
MEGENAMKTAFCYARVSTEEQGNSGLGLEAQERACRAEAKKHGIEDVRLMIEGSLIKNPADPKGPKIFTPFCSGSVPLSERVSLPILLAQIKKNDILIVSHRSRIARDPAIMNDVERILFKIGARLVSAAGEGTDKDVNDPSGILTRGITDVFNHFERAIGRERVRSAMQAKKARGERYGGKIPYGYQPKPDGLHTMERRQKGKAMAATNRARCRGTDCAGCLNLEPHAEEQLVIAKIKELHAQGFGSIRIIKWLDANGIKPRNGKKWFNMQIDRILSYKAPSSLTG